MYEFTIMPLLKLRRDSPITVSIPKEIWKDWYNHNIAMAMAETPLYRDVGEAGGCQSMSADHLKAIIEWWDENNKEIVL